MVYSIAFYVIFVKKNLKTNLFFVNVHIYGGRKLFFGKSFFVDFPFCDGYNKSNELPAEKVSERFRKDSLRW